MVLFVLDDPERLDELLDAWQDAGITGVTIVESTGLYRRRAQMVGARYAIGFPRIVERIEQGHYTLFVIVRDAAEASRCLAAAEAVVGNLDEHHTGVFASWDLAHAKGVIDHNALTPEDYE
jgi:hypothetical protein